MFFFLDRKSPQTYFNYPSLNYSQQDSYMATENTHVWEKQTKIIKEPKGRKLIDNTV